VVLNTRSPRGFAGVNFNLLRQPVAQVVHRQKDAFNPQRRICGLPHISDREHQL
jgi:hypothetical protein